MCDVRPKLVPKLGCGTDGSEDLQIQQIVETLLSLNASPLYLETWICTQPNDELTFLCDLISATRAE